MVKIYKENDKFYMEDGDAPVVEVTKIVTDKKGKDWLILPENSSNRKCIVLTKVTETGIELGYKETRTSTSSGRKKLEDYLTDEERQIIADIMAKCKERKEADKPAPLSEADKLRAKIAKYEALIKELKNK